MIWPIRTNSTHLCPKTGIWQPVDGPPDRQIVLRGAPFPKHDKHRDWMLVGKFE